MFESKMISTISFRYGAKKDGFGINLFLLQNNKLSRMDEIGEMGKVEEMG